jgi:REP element-mobilizing transposase RayT
MVTFVLNFFALPYPLNFSGRIIRQNKFGGVMAGTFSQIYIQIVFSVKGRENLISARWKDELHQYIAGIIRSKDQKPIIVNGMPDHIHIFVGLKPSMAISDLARDVKNNSSNFINDNRLVIGKFSWQEGYGAFSYSHSQIENVYNYILHQEEHHKTKTFREEYTELLRKFEIQYNEKYLFDWLQ